MQRLRPILDMPILIKGYLQWDPMYYKDSVNLFSLNFKTLMLVSELLTALVNCLLFSLLFNLNYIF